jgi:Taurine catabolism dioxygenase TauD, TfdA family
MKYRVRIRMSLNGDTGSKIRNHIESNHFTPAGISDAARRSAAEVRLSPGDLLVVDDRRVLHGRRAIVPSSARRLRRLWVGDANVSARRIPDLGWTSRPLPTLLVQTGQRASFAMHDATTANDLER